MHYQTYLPDDLLRSVVRCFWTLEGPAESLPERQRIVPDGCMELIIHYGDLYQQYLPDGSLITQPRGFVFGQITTPLEIAPTGASGIVAARFEPDGFSSFHTLKATQMENRAVPLEELFGEEGSLLEKRVLEATTSESRIGIIQRFLLERVRNQELINRIASASVELLLQLRGQVNVEVLAEKQGISRRQLERRFAETIGLSPKQLSRMVRLQAAVKAMEQKSYNTLAALAVENGYFDQAHFIRNFKEFTGMNPGQFYADNLRLSSFFIGQS